MLQYHQQAAHEKMYWKWTANNGLHSCYLWTPNVTERKKLINTTLPCLAPTSVGNILLTAILCQQTQLFNIQTLHFTMLLLSGLLQ